MSGAGGSFVNANSATTVFNGVSGTTYDLQWTISNGVCPSTSDNVTIQFTTPPTVATAGSDQTLCSTSCDLSRKHTYHRHRSMDGSEWSRWKLCAEYQSDNDIHWNTRNHLRFTMDDLQWRMYGELRSGNNQTGCKSITDSRCRITTDFMCYVNNLSSQCSDDRYRHLDDREWSRRKLCQCQQSDDSIQWCIRNDL